MGLVVDRSSWVGDSVDGSNSLLPYPIEAHEEKADLAVNVIPLSHITTPPANERQAIHSTPTFIYPNGNLCYNLDSGFFMDESQPPFEDLYSEINFSSRERMLENTSLPLLSSTGTSIISQAFPESLVGSVLTNPLGFQHSPGDSHFISSLSPVWPTAYVSDSLLPPVLSQVGMTCDFGAPEECSENGVNILDQRCQIEGEFRVQDQGDVGNVNIPCFGARSQIPLLENGGQLCPQLSLSDEAHSGKFHASQSFTSCLPSPSPLANACNGTSKPRVRARRGQATDPHSIAERLRRERIAERMRNLQELVPNSNKADKASILDEIIDHVKFLQLQVKVLSMSRLGAAGAVVPLITDLHSEDLSVPLLSQPIDQASGPSKSEDNIALEQEVVQLMESNIKLAMQLLQNKGLCLMPSALASAISSGKTSSDTPASHSNKLLVNELSSLSNRSSDASKNSVKENISRCFEPDEML